MRLDVQIIKGKCYKCDNNIKWKGLCKKHYYEEYKKINKEKLKKQSKKWRLNNLEKLKIQARLYYEQNKEKIKKDVKENYKKRYLKNPEKMKQRNLEYAKQKRIKNYKNILERERLYRLKNKDIINKKNREFYQKNKAKIRERIKKRSKNNIIFHLREILRARVSSAIKQVNVKKFNKSLILLGTEDINIVRTYIEKQFKSGMTWSNHGLKGWHIDHIKPISSFDLTNKEEQKKAFHYTNLQPLWAIENLKKCDKVLE